jgi:formate hydrogenlyase transcriptional activator
MDKQIEKISPEAMSKLTSYAWPGNIRELQNFIERSVILSTGDNLRSSLESSRRAAEIDTVGAITLKDVEREHIHRTLKETLWVIGGDNGAAARLGVKRSTLYSRMEKLGISRSDSKPIPS